MTKAIDTAQGARSTAASAARVDRILVIACIVLWLAALGTGVAAVVALVGLAGGHSVTSGGSDTPWLLYTVIGVSAAVIVGAIPLLIRARQTASAGSASPSSADDSGRSGGAPSGALPLQPFGAPVLRRRAVTAAHGRTGFPAAAVEQVWLRGTVSMAGAMGAAATGIGVATYLMASSHDTAAWIAYGVAALLAIGMPVTTVLHLRQLRQIIDSSR